MPALRVLAAALGVVLVVATLLSAVRTVVVPRAESVGVTRIVFGTLRRLFEVVTRLRPGFAWTDRVMSLYAPASLLSLPLVWLGLLLVAFTMMLWASGEPPARALEVSGSSLLTLGFSKPATAAGVGMAFVGAALVIAIVVLLLVTYLPSMHAAFADREQQVIMLESRAGAPPTGVGLIERMARIRGLGRLAPIWEAWEEWFARVQESHTSQPALIFFRSQRPDHSWITAAGALLDGAALFVSCVDHRALEPDQGAVSVVRDGRAQRIRMPQAEVCIRAGYLCLRDIAAFHRIPFDPDPAPDDPVAVTREEFDGAWERMSAAGVPLVEDRDGAWAAFSGWRVNYETPLLELADLVAAPETAWVSDRSAVLWRRPGRR